MRLNHVVAAFAIVACLSNAASAVVIIGGKGFQPVGPTENLAATFTVNDGGVTTGTYSGLVQLTVSGTGESLGTSLNDAFYVFTDASHTPTAPVNNGSFYQLAFDIVPLVGTNGDPTDPALNARAHILYDIDADIEVAPTYVPGYRADHTYSFVLDTGTLTPENLHFGVSNGNFGDNSGAYKIDITQLGVPVPAVSEWGIASLGLLLMAGLTVKFRGALPKRA